VALGLIPLGCDRGADEDFSHGDDDVVGDDDTATDDDSAEGDDDDTVDDDDTTAGDDDDSGTDDDDSGADDDDSGADDDDSGADDDDTTADDDDDTTLGDDDDTTLGDDDDTTVGDDDDAQPPLTIALVDTGSSGIVPIQTTLTGEGHTVDLLSYSAVETSLDPGYDLLVFPGSSGGVWTVINQPSLAVAIQDFVAAGGGYMGICGGSLAGATDIVYDGTPYPGVGLGLLDVEATWYTDWGVYIGNMTPLQFEVAMGHPVLDGYAVGDPHTGDYAGGPTLYSGTEDVLLVYAQDLDPSLAGHAVTGMGALVAGEYGTGRVVLSAMHPEYNDPGRLISFVQWAGG